MNRWKSWCLYPLALLGLLLSACSPPPVPVLRTGQPALIINWPADQALNRNEAAPDARAGMLQEELLLQLRQSGRFSRVEARPAASQAGAPGDVVLDTTLERLDLRYEYGHYPHFPYSGRDFYGYRGRHSWYSWHNPWYDSYSHPCMVAKINAVLRDARSGEVYLEESYFDRSCTNEWFDRRRERLDSTLGREAMIRAVDRLRAGVEELFF